MSNIMIDIIRELVIDCDYGLINTYQWFESLD